MRSVVITGVSRGLGAALFDELSAAGARLLCLSRGFTDAQRRLAADEPHRVVLRPTDLADPAAVPTADELADFVGAGEAVLVHNAAVVEPIGPVGRLDHEGLARAVAVNLTAPMLLTDAFLAAVERAPRPATILFVSSGAAHRPIDGWAGYCATKAGGEMFFEVVAQQLKDDDRYAVHAVNPGVMDTDMQAAIRRAPGFVGKERFIGLHERGELPTPGTVARRIVAEYLT